MTEEEIDQIAKDIFDRFSAQARIYADNKYDNPPVAAEAKAVMVGILEEIEEINRRLH